MSDMGEKGPYSQRTYITAFGTWNKCTPGGQKCVSPEKRNHASRLSCGT
ncbi:hypothetical protein [Haladaptatus sp. YSMS36]